MVALFRLRGQTRWSRGWVYWYRRGSNRHDAAPLPGQRAISYWPTDQGKVTKESHRNVIRIDRDGTHGWKVHFQRNNHRATRYFSDQNHGGKRKALQASVAWRDATLPRIGLGTKHDNLWRIDNGDSTFWLVEIQSRGKASRQRFDSAKYGDVRQAFEAALAWRDAVAAASQSDLLVRRATRRRIDNSSGIIGVARYVVGGKATGRAIWVASWRDSKGSYGSED